MIRTQVYLTEDLYHEIRLTAIREKKAKAEVLRELLKASLYKRRKKGGAGAALLRIAKLGGKGPKDLSKNIDKYLYGE